LNLVVLKIKSISLLAFLFIATHTFAQRFSLKGMPLIENFTPEQYLNKGKIWDISSAPNGIVYMAADKGLLEYDGKTWKCFKGSSGFTRSLFISNDSLIYTGSDLDFGVWKRNKFQRFDYTSLYPFQKDIKEINEEFWNVVQVKDKILFISFSNIYLYKKGQLTKIPAPFRFTDSFVANDSVYFADEKEGLFVLSNLTLKQVFSYSTQNKFEIKGCYNHNKDRILVTKNSGLISYSNGILKPINNQLSEKLAAAKVFCFKQLNSQQLAFGTVLKGLFITDLEGNIIHHINKKKGIPNNTILSLFYSNKGKLWLGLDQGLSNIDLQNDYTFIYDYMGDFGSGYTACIKDNIFYLGTNQGLYQTNWENLSNNAEFYNFQLILGTEGQVWSLKEVDKTLLIGHDKGLFTLNGNDLQKISNEPGFWSITTYKNEFLISGNYNGICIFKKNNNSWSFVKKMDFILGSCNQVIIEKDNVLWVAIPNFGIIRAILDKNLVPKGRHIIPETAFEGDIAYLSKNENAISLITSKFEYRYNDSQKRFVKITERELPSNLNGIVKHINQSVAINLEYKFHKIFNGFALQFLGNEKRDTIDKSQLIFRQLLGFNNDSSTQFFANSTLPYHQNNVKIDWLVPNQGDVFYQFKTDANKSWTAPSSNNTFEILNLKPGKHTVFAKAIVAGKPTDVKEISFIIEAPWYRTKYMFILYLIGLVAIIYFLNHRKKAILKRQENVLLLKKEKALKEQEEQHNREVLVLEQEMFKNELELLKQQLKSKTIELANKAKDNEDKKHLLLTIKEKFEGFPIESPQTKVRLGEIKRLLDAHLNVEDHTFEIQIDELHQEFFKKLKDNFPSLSTHDLRLCAYLKIGMNSKEIAELLNIQPSSAFVSRSRLRKKLNIAVDEDINTFLNRI
jgi:AraC family transcriptional regulator, chitin signaling transcriptional activator